MLVSTKKMHNIPKSGNEDLDLNIRDNKPEIMQKTKYLGVQIDNSLNWKEHIKTVPIKVTRAMGFFKTCQEVPYDTKIRQETLTTLYTGIVEQHF